MEIHKKKILSFYIKKNNNEKDASFNISYDCITHPDYKNEYEKNFKHIYNYDDDVMTAHIIWEFLHTITFKIKEEFFEKIKIELISKIKYLLQIELFTSCYSCITHTKEYFEKNDLVVNTKNDLVLALYDFHNNVNNKIGNPLFSYTDFCEKYNNISLFLVINNFLFILESSTIPNDKKYELQEWLSSNIEYFIHSTPL